MHETYHIPVLLQESIELLSVRNGGIYVDGTLGGGGHTEAILTAGPAVRVIALDADDDAVIRTRQRLAAFGDRLTIVQDNFRNVAARLTGLGVPAIDGLLLDLGVSSFQLDASDKGFSYRFDGPLDMRMGRPDGPTAADVINGYAEQELARLFFEYGEERLSRRIAKAIVQRRASSPVRTTTDLAGIVAGVLPERHLKKSLSRIFQALRIVINDELETLKKTLNDSVNILSVGGRLVVIAYHSLEDRIVKDFMRYESSDEILDPHFPRVRTSKPARLRTLTRKPVTANMAETESNPRARSAKLRAAERI